MQNKSKTLIDDNMKQKLSSIVGDLKGKKVIRYEELENLANNEEELISIMEYLLSKPEYANVFVYVEAFKKADRIEDFYYQNFKPFDEDDFEDGLYDGQDEYGELVNNSGRDSDDYVKQYLMEIGRIPLLTNEEEITIFKERGDILDSISEKQALIEKSENVKDLEQLKEELEALDKTLKKTNSKIADANLRLVVSIAKRYVGRGLDFLDLIQEGNLGLLTAINKFDVAKGFKFSTYATWWIRQAVTRAIADQARTIRVPVHVVETINKVTRAQRKFTQENNREATIPELAEILQMTTDKVREMLKISQEPVSLETPIGDEEDTMLADFITDGKHVEDYEKVEKDQFKSLINAVMDEKLDKRSAKILRLRFGFGEDDNEPGVLTLEGVADVLAIEEIQKEMRMALEENKISPRIYYAINNYKELEELLSKCSNSKSLNEVLRSIKNTIKINSLIKEYGNIYTVDKIIERYKETDNKQKLIRLLSNDLFRRILVMQKNKTGNEAIKFALKAEERNQIMTDENFDAIMSSIELAISKLEVASYINSKYSDFENDDKLDKIIEAIEAVTMIKTLKDDTLTITEVIDELRDIYAGKLMKPEGNITTEEDIMRMLKYPETFQEVKQRILDNDAPQEVKELLLNEDFITSLRNARLTRERIRQIEQKAIKKLRRDPSVKSIFKEKTGRDSKKTINKIDYNDPDALKKIAYARLRTRTKE